MFVYDLLLVCLLPLVRHSGLSVNRVLSTGRVNMCD